MTTSPNGATGHNGQPLSDEQIIAQLPPEMKEQFRQWKRSQPENPQTPGKDAAEKHDERDKTRPEIELARTGRSLNHYATDVADLLPNNVLYNYGSDVVEIQKPKDQLETPIVSMDPVRFRTWIEKHVRNGVIQTETLTKEIDGVLKQFEVSYFYDQTIKETDSKAVLASDSFKGKLPTVERVLDFPMPVIKGRSAWLHPAACRD